jgi:hypothetical protein
MLASRVRTGLRVIRPRTLIRCMGDHHGPLMPPFARLAPPTSSVSFIAVIFKFVLNRTIIFMISIVKYVDLTISV